MLQLGLTLGLPWDLPEYDRVTNTKTLNAGRRAVVGYEDGTMRIWDLKHGSSLHVLKGTKGSVRLPVSIYLLSGSWSAGRCCSETSFRVLALHGNCKGRKEPEEEEEYGWLSRNMESQGLNKSNKTLLSLCSLCRISSHCTLAYWHPLLGGCSDGRRLSCL